MAATVALPDGSPRFVWTDARPDHDTYVRIVLNSIGERQRRRAQYEAAKTAARGGFDSCPATLSASGLPQLGLTR
jgi:hypothetical protein